MELSSPAMIGGNRVAVTDENGRYRFVRLPVGAYSVTFSLQGFATVKREGVIVNAGFTATINPELTVAALEETVTVTGESPIVDVRSTTQQLVLDDSVIDALPSARSMFDMTKFITGASTSRPDVGGNTTIIYTAIQIHGSASSDRTYHRDGVWLGGYFGSGDAPKATQSVGAQEEMTYQTTAIPASVKVGGMAITMVSKSGGNDFSGSVFASGLNESMQSSNLDQELMDQGVTATSGMKKAYGIDATFGGPFKRDKLWFFGSYRIFSVNTLRANQFFPEGTSFFGDDVGGLQLFEFIRKGQQDFKLTYQANPNNKISFSITHENALRPTRPQGASFVEFEATAYNITEPRNWFFIANYTGTVGDSLILEGKYSNMDYKFSSSPQDGQTGAPCLDFVNSILTCASIRHSFAGPAVNAYHGSATWLGEDRNVALRRHREIPAGSQIPILPPVVHHRHGQIGGQLMLDPQTDSLLWGRLTSEAYVVVRPPLNPRQRLSSSAVAVRSPFRSSQAQRLLCKKRGLTPCCTVVKGSFSKYVGNEASGRPQRRAAPVQAVG